MIEIYIEQLQSLQEPYRSKAIERLDPKYFAGTWGENKPRSAEYAIRQGFVWGKTPEGHKFWRDMVSSLGDGHFKLPPIPESWIPTQLNGIDL